MAAHGTRQDTHRPSSFDPAEYTEVGYYDNHPEDGGMWIAAEAKDLPYFDGNNADRGRCDHCGAGPLRYGVIFLHEPSQHLVVVGQTCAGRLNLGSRSEYERKALLAQAVREAKVATWTAQAPENVEVRAFLNAVSATPYVDDEGRKPFREQFPAIQGSTVAFLDDLCHKLNRWGSLSEKQVAAVLKIKARNEERLAQRATEAEALAGAGPLPEGRTELVGEIVSTKWQESDFGGALKMLVRLDSGNKVWGTMPNSIYAALPVGNGHDWFKGQRVTFTAAVERSSDDEHFGFFKRPTKAQVVWAQA